MGGTERTQASVRIKNPDLLGSVLLVGSADSVSPMLTYHCCLLIMIIKSSIPMIKWDEKVAEG